MVLDEIQPLSIASQRERTVDADRRKVVRDRRRFDADIQPFEDLLLNGRRRDGVKTEFGLVKQRGAEGISVSERKVPHPIISQLREARRRSSNLRGWQGEILFTVGREEASREFALLCV